MSAKKTAPAPEADTAQASLAERASQANLANIVRKVKAGSSLTAAETRTLAEFRRGDEVKASEMLRRGMIVMQKIRTIIEESPLPKTLQRRIMDEIASIDA